MDSNFIDYVKIYCRSGRGGRGSTHMHRAQYLPKGGPDGGNGGRGGIQHIAFAIEDGVANALAEAEAKGCRLIDKAPRKGAEGLNIAFLHPKSTCGALTELCEDPNK